MSELSHQQIVTWLRDQAKKFNETADMIDSVFNSGRAGLNRVGQRPKFYGGGEAVPLADLVTMDKFESEVRKKTGRVADLAYRLGTVPSVVESLMENPDCKVFVGPRGWLQFKS